MYRDVFSIPNSANHNTTNLVILHNDLGKGDSPRNIYSKVLKVHIKYISILWHLYEPGILRQCVEHTAEIKKNLV